MPTTRTPVREGVGAAKASARKEDLEERLYTERDQLLKAVVGEPPEDSLIVPEPGAGDAAAESEIRDLEYSRRSAIRQRLRQVDEAIERLRAQQYGRCAECGQRINRRRLISDPAALLCAPCQASHETGSPGATL